MSEDILKLAVVGREVVYRRVYGRGFTDEEFFNEYLASHEPELKSILQGMSEAQFEKLATNSLTFLSSSENSDIKEAFDFSTYASLTFSRQQAEELKKSFGKALVIGALGLSLTMVLLASRLAEMDGKRVTFYEGVPHELAEVIQSVGDGFAGLFEKILDQFGNSKDDKDDGEEQKEDGDKNHDNSDDAAQQ